MKCKLCDEIFDTKYKIPRNLNCGHCFCEQCLKLYQKENEIECPKCTKISSNKLPICYAIFDIIDQNDQFSSSDYCNLHPLVKKELFCSDDKLPICNDCFILHHNGHNIITSRENIIVKEIVKDFKVLYERINRLINIFLKMKDEVEVYEDFIRRMNEKQKAKITELENNLVIRKNEKIEELNNIIEINYLNQFDVLNKLLLETELRKNYVEIYYTKLGEILQKLSRKYL
jgi:hypothetical protein